MNELQHYINEPQRQNNDIENETEEEKIDKWENKIINHIITDLELFSYEQVLVNIRYHCWFRAGYDWHSIINYVSEDTKFFIRNNIYTNTRYRNETEFIDNNWTYISANLDWDSYINNIININRKYKYKMTLKGIDYYTYNKI